MTPATQSTRYKVLAFMHGILERFVFLYPTLFIHRPAFLAGLWIYEVCRQAV